MYRSFVDLYRALCRPSDFVAETRSLRPRERGARLLRMAPAMFAVQIVLGGAIALLAQAFGVDASWWPNGFLAALFGLLMALGAAMVWSLPFGAAWGVTWGISSWAIGAILTLGLHAVHAPPPPQMTLGPVSVPVPPPPSASDFGVGAIATWMPMALASGVGLGTTMGTPIGVLWGMAAWLGVGAFASADSRFLVMAILLAGFVVGYFRVEWYPVDVVANLVQLSAARRQPRRAREFFQGSPIYWREPIWLTLPGLRSFLRLVGEQDFQAGLQECLFVISERPSQARIARLALMEMVAAHLARLESVPQIAAAAEELGQANAQGVALPGVLEEALPALGLLAQHAGQHLTAVLPHNRRRALERLRDGADELARRLALASDPMGRLLVSVATHWREVAARELTDLGQAETEAGFIHNPYVFGQPIEETETNLFVGRRDTVREIEMSLLGAEQKPALVLWGPRRMGKTSVLLQLPRLLGPEFCPAFVDMQAAGVRESISAFFRTITAASAHALRRCGIPAAGLEAADLATDPFMAFSDWMEGLEEVLGERYLLLCLDEFERLEQSVTDGHLPAALMDEIRHIIQHHPRIVLLLAGSHRPDELELNWPDTLISTKMIHVSYLSEEEARRLITDPVPGFEVSYHPESVDRILAVTRCQPYLVQAVCYELVNYLNLESRREADPDDTEAAVMRALDSAHLYFAEMWRQFTASQRLLLSPLARQPDGLPLDQLAAHAGLSPDLALLDLKRLEARGTLEFLLGEGLWRYQVPLTAAWVQHQES